ncbi:MAG: signal peptidase I [Clostridiaceae bacterium]|nr:signal peptidase I [Clostridiaceae bacterium]
MKVLKTISKVISICTYSIIFVLLILIFLPRLFGYKPYSVISGSMEPKYNVGSMIYVKDISFDELSVGDIVTFKESNIIVSHRIIDIDYDNKSIVTKGDANNVKDGTMYANNIIGKASNFSIPLLGFIVAELAEVKGKILILIILGSLLFISSVLNSVTKKEKGILISEGRD